MELDFDKMNGLVPAIIQDNETRKVLMLGFTHGKRRVSVGGLIPEK